MERIRANPDAKSKPSRELVDQIKATVAGRISREELLRWLDEQDTREMLEPLRPVVFPKAACRRWLEACSGESARDDLDKVEIRRAREQYMRWHALVEEQARDLLRLHAVCLSRGWLEADSIAEQIRAFIRWYRSRDEIIWWPKLWAREPGEPQTLTLLDLMQRQLDQVEGPEHGFR